MSISTLIQWADDTVNPVMGCTAPCELRPTPTQARDVAARFFADTFPNVAPAKISETLDPQFEGYNVTEIYQLRDQIVGEMFKTLSTDPIPGRTPERIKESFKAALDEVYICYAHQQTMFRGSDITNPDKRTNPGFPVQFEIPKEFPVRVAEGAMRPDLFMKQRRDKPWLDFLPRTFFVSDMADALSEEIGFDYLKREIVDVVSSTRGRLHLWFWLTKMPYRMAEFAGWLKSDHGATWPDNLVAMTSVTSQKTVVRARQLLKIPSKFRGLSVEPLWEDVTLPLDGIDWCIIGGQSGAQAKPFDLAWVKSVQAQCGKSGTAFFVKQLGARPVSGRKAVRLADVHGGSWDEWPPALRVRDVPAGFRTIRRIVSTAGKTS